MNHTLMKYLLVGTVAPVIALAQFPPLPPTPPSPPVAPTPPLPPMPPMSVEPKFDFRYDFQYELAPRLEELRVNLDAVRQQAVQELAAARVKVEIAQPQIQIAMERARADMERVRADFRFSQETIEVPQLLGDRRSEKLLNTKPRAAWANEDPADSLYRAARESLNRGEYRRAAQLFNEVTKKFPKSQYALDCAYWEAFSRYRSGTTDDLRAALRILDEGKDKFAYLRSSESDVAGLRARVQGALAARGDAAAARQLQAEATQNTSCDREDVSVRAEALSALGQMDLASAMPVVKKVLARRDECTVELRRRALYLIGRQPSADAAPLLLDVAKNDTDAGIRSEAMSWLSRTAGDQAVPLLEDLLKTSTDERTQRSAVNALGSIDTDKARKAVRAIIERADVLERVRIEAIQSLARDRDNRMMSAEDLQYLRSLYAKLETPRLKEAVLSAIGRVETPESEQFLLGVARNETESPSLRAAALQRLGRMQTVSLTEIGKLYEAADSRSMREQILQALSQRKEPEAIDKLVEVAKKDTDYYIRRTAIQILSRSNNPKALQGIKELAASEKP
jgi:HEAT repeat protein